MHDHGPFLHPGGPNGIESESSRVLTEVRNQSLVHALALHAQHVDHVGIAKSRVEVVGDLDSPRRRIGWHQRAWTDQTYGGAERRERFHVTARDSTVAYIAHDRDGETTQTRRCRLDTEGADDRMAIEQRLSGVLVPSIARIDDRGIGPVRHLPRNTTRLVSDDEGRDAHRAHGLDGVAQTLTLVDTRCRHAERHGVGRQAPCRRLERDAGTRGVLEEQTHHGLADQSRHLGHRSAIHFGHVLGHFQDAHDAVDPELVDTAHVLHRGATFFNTTASGVTWMSSSRLVGMFLPT